MRIYTSSGELMETGAEMGRGGEGTVYEITGRPEWVAKIYHQSIGPEQVAKIKTMVRGQKDHLQKVAAWPLDTVQTTPGAGVAGILLPKLSGFREIHRLYGPKSRLADFPGAGWHFLVHAALNLARAFAVIHRYGHVVGDVNHGNVFVSDQALVRFIDCDSFQIASPSGIHLCEVGVSTHQPPEFQEQNSYRGLLRTSNHDCFGLAVLSFQLLFMGRHPFSGRYLGRGEMPLERAIREYRFAYGSGAASRKMEPPPHTLPLEALSPSLIHLFEQAFFSSSSHHRPSAEEWSTALEDFRSHLVRCERNGNHYFYQKMDTCPWCRLESRSGIYLFHYRDPEEVTGEKFNLSSLWEEILTAPPPGPAPTLSDPSSYHEEPAKEIIRYMRTRRLILGGMVVTIFIAGIGTWIRYGIPVGIGVVFFLGCLETGLYHFFVRRNPKIAATLTELDTQTNKYRQLLQTWKKEASEADFKRKQRILTQARQDYLHLQEKREEKLRELRDNREQLQREEFLNRFDLQTARIKGIGPSRKAILQSYGIQTAADVRMGPVLLIQGFGPVYATALLNWRKAIEKKFRYNPTKPFHPQKLREIEGHLRQEKLRLEQTLRNGPRELQQISARITSRRQKLLQEIDLCLTSLARARANCRILKKQNPK